MFKYDFARSVIMAGLLASSVGVFAAPVSTETEAEPSAAVFTLQTATELARTADAGQAASPFADPAAAASAQRPERHALADPSLGEADSQAALSLTLWSFARAIQAQQQGNPFEMLQTSLFLQDVQITAQAGEITAVPLPGAVWLFVMGLLGLVGSRITRTGGEAGAARPHHAHRPIGAALPA